MSKEKKPPQAIHLAISETNRHRVTKLGEEIETNPNLQVIKIKISSKKGIANMHKKYRRQDRDPGWLSHNQSG